eukprot:6194044-Pleurochrysis_carterae.AAC.2
MPISFCANFVLRQFRFAPISFCDTFVSRQFRSAQARPLRRRRALLRRPVKAARLWRATRSPRSARTSASTEEAQVEAWALAQIGTSVRRCRCAGTRGYAHA